MPRLSNAERQRRWRAKRNTLAKQATRLRDGLITGKERQRAVRQLLEPVNPQLHPELVRWLRDWIAGKLRRDYRRQKQRDRADQREQRRAARARWLAEHPGRTSKEYTKLQYSNEMHEWRKRKGREFNAAENAAWLRDHPGNPLPEHLCSLTDAEYLEYERWRVKRDSGDLADHQ
jgi:hypothetical protein